MTTPNLASTATQIGGPTGAANGVARRSGPDSLADILERVLDKGVVIVGDIGISLLDIELLTLKIRLLVASVDTAKEMGIDWWTDDPFYSSRARQVEGQADRSLESDDTATDGTRQQGAVRKSAERQQSRGTS